MMERILTYEISEEYSDLRVGQYLRRLGYSRQNLTELKKMPGSVLSNGRQRYLNQRLHTGDTLRIHIQENVSSPKIPPVRLPLSIIYEDEDLLVVDKPAGMPIHPSLHNYRNSLANALAWYFQQQGKMCIRDSYNCSKY